MREIADRITFLKAGLAGSYARLGVAPTAPLSLALTVNGVTEGSLSFAANAVQGAFTLAQDVLLMPEDVLAVMRPGSADAAASDLTLSVAGTQT